MYIIYEWEDGAKEKERKVYRQKSHDHAVGYTLIYVYIVAKWIEKVEKFEKFWTFSVKSEWLFPKFLKFWNKTLKKKVFCSKME